jgi:hypothetical protein
VGLHAILLLPLVVVPLAVAVVAAVAETNAVVPSGLTVRRLLAALHSETSARGQDAALNRFVSVTKFKNPPSENNPPLRCDAIRHGGRKRNPSQSKKNKYRGTDAEGRIMKCKETGIASRQGPQRI